MFDVRDIIVLSKETIMLIQNHHNRSSQKSTVLGKQLLAMSPVRQSNSDVEPHWPKDRGDARYDELAGFNIRSFLCTGGLWIDVGPGTDASPMKQVLSNRAIKVKAIGPHHRNLPTAVAFTRGSVPSHLQFLRSNRERAKLVTDIYGAVSYCEDPIQSLIYEALLLTDGGVLVAFTELHRFGDLGVWDRITNFMRCNLRQTVSFQTKSDFGDDSQTFSTCLRIRVDGRAFTRYRLRILFENARREIGVPKHGAGLWVSSDGKAVIQRVDYVLTT